MVKFQRSSLLCPGMDRYPRYVRNNIIRKLKERKKNLSKQDSSPETEDTPKIWFRVPYIGPTGEKFAKQCIAKSVDTVKKTLSLS